MIKNIAWNIFKNTGDVNTFLELKRIENLEKNANIYENIKVKTDGNNKDKGNNNFRK